MLGVRKMKILFLCNKLYHNQKLPRTRFHAVEAISRIADVKFRTLGCAAAIATSSITTDMAMGKTLEEAQVITRQQVADALGGLPPNKMHCSNLAAQGLQAAIKDYLAKTAAAVKDADSPAAEGAE